MTTRQELAAIAALAAAASAAAEARMALLQNEATRLQDQIADLDAQRQARAHAATVEDSAVRAGADLRWERWVMQRRTALFSALARQRALIEDERLALGRALGRKIASQELADRAEQAHRARLDRDA